MTSGALKDTDWAYMAGFVDADGCISANTRQKWANYYPRLSISQVTPDYLEFMQNHFGGSLRHRVPSGVGKNMIWNLQIPSGGTRLALAGMLPYLRYKRIQAEIALLITGHPKAEELVLELKALKRSHEH